MSALDRIRNIVRVTPNNNKEGNGIVSESAKKIKRLISHNALVPVICEDMFVYTNPETGEVQSLNSYIVEYILSYYINKGLHLEFTEAEIRDMLSNGYFGLSLLRNKIGYDLYENVYNAIIDDDDNLVKGIGLKKECLEFLQAATFPLIITTNCFPIIENYLVEYESYYNHIETRNDSSLPSKCVYHIFGEARIEDPNWGYDDKQILNYLRSIFSTEYSLKNLISSMSQGRSRKTFLILGNDAPDWLFRFILTPIYGGDVYDSVKGFYMGMTDCKKDIPLDLFLHDIKFKKEIDIISILNEVTESLQCKSYSKMVEDSIEIQYDIFLSHASEDSEAVKTLVKILRNKDLKVWVDMENLKDGNYWHRIIDALKKSRYFMPFVTEKFILKNKKRSDIIQLLSSIDLDIENISLESSSCIRMESVLDGVQIELLMADIIQRQTNRDPYSLPVILDGSSLFFSPINPAYIRVCSEDSKLLPQSLFWGLQVHLFRQDNTESFSLDFNRYKS